MSILIIVVKILAGVFVSFAVGLFIGKFISVGQGTQRAEPQDDEERV